MTSSSEQNRTHRVITNREGHSWVEANNNFPQIFTQLANNLGETQILPLTLSTETGVIKYPAEWTMLQKNGTKGEELWLTVRLEPNQRANNEHQSAATKLELRAILTNNALEVTGSYNNKRENDHRIEFRNAREFFFGIDLAWSQWLANFSQKIVVRAIYPFSPKVEDMIKSEPGFIPEDFYGDQLYSKTFSPKNSQ